MARGARTNALVRLLDPLRGDPRFEPLAEPMIPTIPGDHRVAERVAALADIRLYGCGTSGSVTLVAGPGR